MVMDEEAVKQVVGEWAIARVALKRIAGLGMDAPLGMERRDFHRDQLVAAIGKAARTLDLMQFDPTTLDDPEAP